MNISRIHEYIKTTDGTDLLTRRQLDKFLLTGLNDVLRRVRAFGGVYKDYPESVDSLAQFAALVPLMDEKAMKDESISLLIASQSAVNRVITQETSATAGSPKRVYYTQEDMDRTVAFFAAGIGEFLHPGDVCIVSMPSSRQGVLNTLIAKAIEKLGALPVIADTSLTYGEMMGICRKSGAESIVAMPGNLLARLRFMRHKGYLPPFRNVLLSADICDKTIENAIIDILGCDLYPHYGSRESGLGGAITCAAHSGMHLRENDLYAEILPKSRDGADGNEGELVLTAYRRSAMPLIRYRTGDCVRLIKDQCACGSPVVRLDSVRRMQDEAEDVNRYNALFACEDIIDFRVSIDREGKKHILAGLAKSLTDDIPYVPPDGEEIGFVVLSESDRPFYNEKRKMLREDDKRNV